MNQITARYITENGACYEQYVITDPAAKTALTITPERGGMITGFTLDGVLFSVARPYGYYPVTAGVLAFTALLQHHGQKVTVGARPEWLDKLFGSTEVRDTLRSGDLSHLFQSWIEGQDEYLKTKVDLYR